MKKLLLMISCVALLLCGCSSSNKSEETTTTTNNETVNESETTTDTTPSVSADTDFSWTKADTLADAIATIGIEIEVPDKFNFDYNDYNVVLYGTRTVGNGAIFVRYMSSSNNYIGLVKGHKDSIVDEFCEAQKKCDTNVTKTVQDESGNDIEFTIHDNGNGTYTVFDAHYTIGDYKYYIDFGNNSIKPDDAFTIIALMK